MVDGLSVNGPQDADVVRNAADVRAILERSGKVLAAFHGHDHAGNHKVINGIHYYTLIAVVELWIAVTHVSDPWISIMLATIGATSAMLGPGAFSIDAVLFGRRHLDV